VKEVMSFVFVANVAEAMESLFPKGAIGPKRGAAKRGRKASPRKSAPKKAKTPR
jgi:hypothetical protein